MLSTVARRIEVLIELLESPVEALADGVIVALEFPLMACVALASVPTMALLRIASTQGHLAVRGEQLALGARAPEVGLVLRGE